MGGGKGDFKISLKAYTGRYVFSDLEKGLAYEFLLFPSLNKPVAGLKP